MANQTNYDGISFAPQEEGATDVGYLNVSPDQITKDPRFLTDLRKYYADYGKYFSTDQEYLDEFYEDATWRDLNTAGAVIGATYTAGESKETRAIVAHAASHTTTAQMFMTTRTSRTRR